MNPTLPWCWSVSSSKPPFDFTEKDTEARSHSGVRKEPESESGLMCVTPRSPCLTEGVSQGTRVVEFTEGFPKEVISGQVLKDEQAFKPHSKWAKGILGREMEATESLVYLSSDGNGS